MTRCAPHGRTTLSAQSTALLETVRRGRCPHRPVCHGSAVASSLPCVKAAQRSPRSKYPWGASPRTPRSGVIPSQCSHWRGNPSPFFMPPAASFLSTAKEKRKRNAAKNYVFGFPCAPSHGNYHAKMNHANAVPWKLPLNVASSLLLFPLPLLL